MTINVLLNKKKLPCKKCGEVHKYFTKEHKIIIVPKDFEPFGGGEVKTISINNAEVKKHGFINMFEPVFKPEEIKCN